ncbi:N-formylglutamate amidohydrolase [Pandoraea terrae]|uniref:N-formylglutamate amidohydrolase n=1 Tax=Pandoraea terrae TaxID=1537710 RepID=A0A5E4RQ94_9BURK|nr:N-formylglutamate deformylase [Pandoraea terrae]VVD65570.1 N-formylglutamate amidohydrolase [Pandoraea terrae]
MTELSQPTYTLHRGTAPLLISIPHAGTQLPAEIARRMAPIAAHLDDTDWHLPRLYAFAAELGASILVPANSRYVIDLNRPPNDENLYPGRSTTGLCPVDTFEGTPLYAAGAQPDDAERAARLAVYWQPYHSALQGELERLRAEHGVALLWEAHSIRSVIPRLFDGRLPDLNLGTADGAACGAGIGETLRDIAARHDGYSAVLNGRFKGGYITRAYGKPAENIHAVQLEMTQCAYMEEARPYAYDEAAAARVTPVLRELLRAYLDWGVARSK